MVGKLSIEPCGTNPDFGFSNYSYLRVCIGDLVWRIAVSRVVSGISSVKRLKGVGNLQVVLVCNINGKIVHDDEVWNLGYEASRKLGSQAVSDLIKQVDRWELSG